ncbi:MAG: S26 family signal peptidase [Pirellulales bacterium]
MAPALLGAHREIVCPGCGRNFAVGAEAAAVEREIPCSRCGTPLPRSVGRLILGDRVLLDRFTYCTRDPRRLELVAFRSPEGRGELAVKRVLGLPGEELAIREGDLWVDGRRLQKTRAEFRSQAVLVGDLEPLPADPAGVTRFVYGPVTDDLPYNGALPHRIASVGDVALEATIEGSGQGTVELRLPGQRRRRVQIELAAGVVQLCEGESSVVSSRLPAGEVPLRLWFGHWDGQCELWAGEERILAAPQSTADKTTGAPLGSAELVATGQGVRVKRVRLWRDLDLTPAPDRRAAPVDSWQLGPDEFFVAGDNQAISEDSRTWRRPGLPRGAIVGRPTRWPW